MRCASYARYSSDLQRDSSIEDQFRTCRGFAAHHAGWTVLERYTVADEAISGAAKAGRNALNFLIEEAKRKPRPYDCILIDDTSRLARNVDGDGIREFLEYLSNGQPTSGGVAVSVGGN